jgi:cytochrome c oxidase subunit 2
MQVPIGRINPLSLRERVRVREVQIGFSSFLVQRRPSLRSCKKFETLILIPSPPPSPAGRGGKKQRQYLSTASIALLLSACTGPQSALNPAGPQAGRIDSLWWLMFWVCTAVLVLVMLALFYALWHRRRQSPPDPDPWPNPRSEYLRTIVVGGLAAATVTILFLFLFASFNADRALASLPTENALDIEVTGHQWWWEVQYVDAVASRRVTTANEIHIPVGRPVSLKLKSNDVIHSLWVPNLAGKKDLIPGHEADLTLRADRPGQYRGQCAEFCGYQHAKMGLLIVAEPPEVFAAWLEAQRATPSPPADPLLQRGQRVFLSGTCSLCHTIQGTSAFGRVAPDLTHIASRQTLAAAALPNSPGNRAGWIVDSQRIKPGNHMPPNPLEPQDLQALLAYLESLK